MDLNYTSLDKTQQLHDSYTLINNNIAITSEFTYTQQNYYIDKYLEDTVLADILENTNFNICKKLIFYETAKNLNLYYVGSPLPVLKNNVLKIYAGTGIRYTLTPQIGYSIFYVYVQGTGNYTIKYRTKTTNEFKLIPNMSLIKPDSLWTRLEIQIEAVDNVALNGFGIFYDYKNELSEVTPYLSEVIYFDTDININDLYELPFFIYPSTQIFDYNGNLLVPGKDYEYINETTIKFLKAFKKSDYILLTDLYNIRNNVNKNNEILNQLNKDLANNLTLLRQQFSTLTTEIEDLETSLNNSQTNLSNAQTNYNNISEQINEIVLNMQSIVIDIDGQLDIIEATIVNYNKLLDSLNNKQLTDFTSEINTNFVTYFNNKLTPLETELNNFVKNALPIARYETYNSTYSTEYQKLTDFQSRNTVINNNITSLNNSIANLQPNLTGYNNRITTVNTALGNIETDLADKQAVLDNNISTITTDKNTLLNNVNELSVNANAYFTSIQAQMTDAQNSTSTALNNAQPYIINIADELTGFTATLPADCVYDKKMPINITSHSSSIMGTIFYQLKTPENKIYNYTKADTFDYQMTYNTSNIGQTKVFYLRATDGYYTTPWVGYNVFVRDYNPPVAVLNSDPDHGDYPVMKEYYEYTIDIVGPDGSEIIDSNVTYEEIPWAYNTDFRNTTTLTITPTKVSNNQWKVKVDRADWTYTSIDGGIIFVDYRVIDHFIKLTVSATESHYITGNTIINNIQIWDNKPPIKSNYAFNGVFYSNKNVSISGIVVAVIDEPVVGNTYTVDISGLYDDDITKGITVAYSSVETVLRAENVNVTVTISNVSGYSYRATIKVNSVTWTGSSGANCFFRLRINATDKHGNEAGSLIEFSHTVP